MNPPFSSCPGGAPTAWIDRWAAAWREKCTDMALAESRASRVIDSYEP